MNKRFNLKSILMSQIKDIKNTQINLLRASSPSQIDKPLDDFYQNIINSFKFIEVELDEYVYSAYYPFLDLIRQNLSTMSSTELDTLWDEIDIYSLHRNILKEYILAGSCSREEEIIPEELDFELTQMIQSILKIFFRIYDSPAIIVIKNIELLPYSTLLLIQELIGTERNAPLFFIFTSIDIVSLTDESKLDILQEIYKSDMQRFHLINLKNLLTDFRKTRRIEIIHKAHTLQEALSTYHLCAMHDSREILSQLYLRHINKGSVTRETLFIIRYLIHADLYLRDSDDAGMYCNQFIMMAQQIDDQEMLCCAYRLKCLNLLAKDDLINAEKMAILSQRIACEIDDKRLQLYANIALLIIYNLQRNVVFDEYFNLVLQQSKDLVYENTFAYLATFPHGFFVKESATFDTDRAQGIKLAKKYHNNFRLAAAYQAYGLFYHLKGDYSKVILNYKKSLKIREKMNDNLTLAYVTNGIGYYHIITSHYGSAIKYFKNSLSLLEFEDDFHEIGMTCFNLSHASYLLFQYKDAIYYMEQCLALLKEIGMRQLSYHSQFGMYSLMGLCYYKAGNHQRALEIYYEIESNELKPIPELHEELFHHSLLSAYLYEDEKDLKKTEFCFIHSYTQYNDKSSIFYLEPLYYYELGCFYQRMKLTDQAITSWHKGLSEAKRQNNLFYEKVLDAQIKNEVHKPNISNTDKKTEDRFFKSLRQHAKHHHRLSRLHTKIDEVNFLKLFQDILQDETNKEMLIIKTLKYIKNNFLFDIILFHTKKEEWELQYALGIEEDSLEYNESSLFERLNSQRDTHFINDLSDLASSAPSFLDYQYLLNFFFSTEKAGTSHILCLSKRTEEFTNAEDLGILHIAVKQLGDAIERLEQKSIIIAQNARLQEDNIFLKEISSTDELTQLGNRKALSESLSSLTFSRNESVSISLLFIDLDNFKYYNDTFGHSAGDEILILFSEILKLEMRGIDHAYRFGGDEFIILLPNTAQNGAIRLADRINSRLRMKKGFSTDLSLFLKDAISIPENKHLSCSIGIVEYSSKAGETHISEDIISKADQALYFAKNSGKDQYALYSEIKDLNI